MVIEDKGIIISFQLRNTRFKMCLELTFEEYRHYCYLLGRPVPPDTQPMNQTILKEMQVLLEHVST